MVSMSAATVVRFSRAHSSVTSAGSDAGAAVGAADEAAADGAGALLAVVAVSDAHAASSNTAATAEIAGTNRLRMLIASPLLGSRPYPEGVPILT
jgi:hypothetical protein